MKARKREKKELCWGQNRGSCTHTEETHHERELCIANQGKIWYVFWVWRYKAWGQRIKQDYFHFFSCFSISLTLTTELFWMVFMHNNFRSLPSKQNLSFSVVLCTFFFSSKKSHRCFRVPLQLLVTMSFHRKHVHCQNIHISEGSKTYPHNFIACHGKSNITGMWAHSDPVLINKIDHPFIL